MDKKNDHDEIKVYLYIISLNLLFKLIIAKILVLNLQNLYRYTDFNWVNIKELFNWFKSHYLFLKVENLFLLISCIILCILSEILYRKIKNKHFKQSVNIPIKIINVEKKDTEAITFMVTYIVPLLFIDLKKWDEIVIGILILFIIGIMSLRTDLYLSNPTLYLRGFKLYRVNIEDENGKIKGSKTVISVTELKEDQEIKYINLR